MYGITKEQRKRTIERIKKQETYLSTHCFNKGTHNIRMLDIVKTPIFNSNKYLSEVNHRVYSLNEYAISKNLKNIFGTITLPSEYHPYKTYNGNRIRNPKYKGYTPNEGSIKLSKMFKSLLDLRVYRDIPKDCKCYFRVYEPHKSGVPHLHFSMYVPEDKINEVLTKFSAYMNMNYKGLQVDFQTNINNPVAYLMKYILKTFDDLRKSSTKKAISDLSIWYISNRITRFYTSRTLVSLDIYRKLTGKYSLIQLTRMYKNKEIAVFIDPDTNKVVSIYDNIGEIWKKSGFTVQRINNKTDFRQRSVDVSSLVRLTYCDIVNTEQYTNIDGESVNIEKIESHYSEFRNISKLGVESTFLMNNQNNRFE